MLHKAKRAGLPREKTENRKKRGKKRKHVSLEGGWLAYIVIMVLGRRAIVNS